MDRSDYHTLFQYVYITVTNLESELELNTLLVQKEFGI